MNLRIDDSRGYRIYRNLHHRTWTIQQWVINKGWRKVGEAEHLIGTEIRFVVNRGRYYATLARGRKVVHAFAECRTILVPPICFVPRPSSSTVTYNPYHGPLFHDMATGETVGAVDSAYFTKGGHLITW